MFVSAEFEKKYGQFLPTYLEHGKSLHYISTVALDVGHLETEIPEDSVKDARQGHRPNLVLAPVVAEGKVATGVIDVAQAVRVLATERRDF